MESNNLVKAFWYMSNNFGDNLNYFLIKAITGKEPVICSNKDDKHFIVCGSIITEANLNSIVWGAGFANYGESINNKIEVIGVRGELSMQQLGKTSMLGDPSLLMPLYYYPTIEKKYKVGIIPHWLDVEELSKLGGYLINPLKPVKEVIDDILSCECIISSSLHGLILSDAYGVPNRWIKTDKPIGGDGFKFADYYTTTKNVKLPNYDSYFVSEYKYSLNQYLKSCPML